MRRGLPVNFRSVTSSVADALVGRVIDGRYRILSHLADGGMASVYVALDGRLDREVALKIMRPGLATDDVFVERFRAEARSAARLNHPNVVAVFDQGEDDGEVFLAMELVEGKTLRDVIHEEAPLTARESLAILEPILLALRAAHVAGMIHRDVKPENVIVRRDGEVKVADFGLARAITNQATTSQTGVLLGTVSYLSPEQVERGVADTRSDVYAAGLLLFEMLTGRKAVTGGTPIQIAYNHVHGSIVAPSIPRARGPGRRSTTSSHARRRVEPDDRFESADGLRHRPARGPARPVGGRARPARRPRSCPTPPAPSALAARLRRRRGCPPPTRPRRADAADCRPERHRTRPNERRACRPRRPARPRRRPRRSSTPRPCRSTDTAAGRSRRVGPSGSRPPSSCAAARSAGWWFTAGPGRLDRRAGRRRPADLAGRRRDASRPPCRSRPPRSSPRPRPRASSCASSPPRAASSASSSTVRVVVSKGKERYAVPKLVGLKARRRRGRPSRP